tara:strand:- start:8525 stop:9706 length:1182 start_codon:yes stop_codon:yes gene_type:complete
MIKLAILGATGMAGREALLHQQYLDSIGLQYADITCVTASPRNKGNLLGDVVAQKEEALVQAYPFWNSMVCPPKLARLQLDPLDPDLIADKADYVISALDGDLAYDLEPSLRERGVGVFSNASSSRWDPTIPLLIPEVNPEDIAMLTSQGGGVQICNPNCTTAGYTPLIKALEDLGYTLSTVNLVTQQSISGKGDAIAEGEYVKRLLGNVADDWTNEGHNGEEWKSAYEPQRILGRVRSLEDLEIEIEKVRKGEPSKILPIWSQTTRVATQYGHLEHLTLTFSEPVDIDNVRDDLSRYRAPEQIELLPSSPIRLFYLFEDNTMPEPRSCINLEQGMAVLVGDIQKHSPTIISLTTLTHNLRRGATWAGRQGLELYLAEYSDTIDKQMDKKNIR